MSLFSLSCILTGIVSLLFGLFVVANHPQAKVNRLWGFVSLSVALWSIGLGLVTNTADYADAVSWLRVHYLGAILIPVFFLHFVFALLKKKHPFILRGVYGLAVVMVILSFAGKLADIAPKASFAFYTKPLEFYPAYVMFFFGAVVYAHSLLLKEYRATLGQRREQIKYLFLGSSVGFIGGSTAFFPVFDWPIFPYGMYLVALYIVIIGYAILRYRLMDISIVINKGLAYSLLLCVVFVPSYLAIAVSHRATPYSIPDLLAGTLIFSCGLWIVLNNYRKAANITFGLVCLAVSSWLFGAFMTYSSTQEEEARLWEKLLHIGVVYIPAFFYHFCVSFLQAEKHNKRVLANYLISTVFLLLIPTPYLINDHYSFFWGYYPKAGPLHPLYLAYFASVSVASLLKLYRGAKAKEGSSLLEATRIKYVFWAFAVGYLASVDFVQSYGYEFYPLGYFFVTLWVLIVSYATMKYQLLDISRLTKTPQAVLFLQALALIPLYLAILLLLRVFTGSTEFVLAGVIVAVFSIFAGLFVNLQEGIEKVVENVLFRKKFNAYQTLQDFSKAMVTILNLKTLIEEIERTLGSVLGVETVTLYLFDKERRVYAPVSTYGVNVKTADMPLLTVDNELPRHLAMWQTILVTEEVEHFSGEEEKHAFIDALRRVKADVCIPFVNRNALIGFCVLGPRTTRQMYSDQDLSLLTMLALAAAIALDNAMLYEELKRSQSLVRRTDRLRSLETIAGGFAHEVRNPLTSIKTFIQLTPERKDDPEFIGHFSTVVAEDVARIERLIQEILDYARYMQPKFQEEDVNVIVESCLYFIRIKADSKGVWLKKDLTSDLPPVLLDRQQIKQVLLNLFINAIEAMGDDGQLIVRTRRLAKAPGDTWAQIEVTDTGCGIPPADLEHIFDPFYTTKHESKEHEGTGLGLTIVHQIVQEHGGHIEVKSEFGRGTTFLVNLPTVPARVLEAPIETRGV
jgi:signal transduction histidine kinase